MLGSVAIDINNNNDKYCKIVNLKEHERKIT